MIYNIIYRASVSQQLSMCDDDAKTDVGDAFVANPGIMRQLLTIYLWVFFEIYGELEVNVCKRVHKIKIGHNHKILSLEPKCALLIDYFVLQQNLL